MKQVQLFLLIVALSITFARAQSVVNSAGGSLSNAQFEVSYAVGEVAITPYTNAANLLTQGVLQPYLETIGIDDPWDGYTLTAYPNPTTGELTINSSYPSFDALEVVNALGQSVLKLPFTYQSVSLAQLAVGTYHVRVWDTQNQLFKTINILKK